MSVTTRRSASPHKHEGVGPHAAAALPEPQRRQRLLRHPQALITDEHHKPARIQSQSGVVKSVIGAEHVQAHNIHCADGGTRFRGGLTDPMLGAMQRF